MMYPNESYSSPLKCVLFPVIKIISSARNSCVSDIIKCLTLLCMQNNDNYIVHACTCTCTWYIKHRSKKCIMLELTANLLILQYICEQWFQFLLFYSITTKLLICPYCANIMHAAAYTTQHTWTDVIIICVKKLRK